MKKKETQKKQGTGNKVLTVVGAIICIILIPILVMNCIMIIKSYTQPDKVPGVGGTLPLIVLTDSMYPYIKSGDLIICHTEDPADVQVGDVISFFDPDGNGKTVVTHRVVELVQGEDGLSFRTKGDANNVEDKALVPAEKLVGVYRSRIAGAGNVAMFMQTTPGLIICIAVPIILLVGYDMLRRRKYEKSRRKDTDELMAELEALRAAQVERDADTADKP